MAKGARKRARKVPFSPLGDLLDSYRQDVGIAEETLAKRAQVALNTWKNLIRSPRRSVRLPRLRSLWYALCLNDADWEAIVVAWNGLTELDYIVEVGERQQATSRTVEEIARAVETSHALEVDDDARAEFARWLRADGWRKGLEPATLATLERAHPYNWLDDETYPARVADDADAWRESRAHRAAVLAEESTAGEEPVESEGATIDRTALDDDFG